MRGTQRQFSGMPLGPVEKPVEKFLSSAFSTEIAVTATKQSENLFPATRIYIAEPATLVLAVKKGPPSPGTSGPLYCRTFVLQERSRAMSTNPINPSRRAKSAPVPSSFTLHFSLRSVVCLLSSGLLSSASVPNHTRANSTRNSLNPKKKPVFIFSHVNVTYLTNQARLVASRHDRRSIVDLVGGISRRGRAAPGRGCGASRALR